MVDQQLAGIPEIAAGNLQLLPTTDRTQPAMVAALGSCVEQAYAAWIACDIVTADPRAYVALINCPEDCRVVSAAGLAGDDADAAIAADVIRRYAAAELGIAV
jgi:hypothetical protein